VDVADIMTKASITDSASDTIKAAASLMWAQQTGSLVVVDGDALMGIITERDVMKAVARGLDPSEGTVDEVMTRDVVTVMPDSSLYEVARLMAARWIRHVPVVDDEGGILGMVSQRDLVGVLAAFDNDPDAIELAADELVRDQRLVRIEQGDLD
jgi:CBS domain-containing protein